MDTTNILSQLKKPLKIEDVDFRIQSISEKGWATILAYKDARVDMNRLDAVCGTNWQKDFKTIEGRLYCGVAIKIDNEWLWRWDVGTESFSDKEKGQASDAFKRACFNWGIGRELYNYPHIMVQLNSDEFTVSDYNGKKSAKQTYNLKLKEWKWTADVDAEGNVLSLSAIDQRGNTRFSFPKNQVQNQQPRPAEPKQEPQRPAGELPWLNKIDTDGKSMTKQWHTIVQRIVNNATPDNERIKSIVIIKQHFRLSKENEAELNQLINTVNNGSV